MIKNSFDQRDQLYNNLKADSLAHCAYLRNEKALDKRVSKINNYFFGEKRKEFFEWMGELKGICSIYCCEASFSILKERSLNDFYKVHKYLCCYMQCNIKVPKFSPVHRPYTYYQGRVNDLSLTIIFSVILNDNVMLKECIRLIDGLRENDFEEQFVADMPYLDFVINLAKLTLSEELINIDFETNFNQVFETWNDLDGLKRSIENILDYHLEVGKPGKEHHSDSHEKYYPSIGYSSPFDTYDVMAIPYEVIAIYKIRQQMGLPFPEINHPLLTEELLALFSGELSPEYTDDLLESIYSFIRIKES